VDVLINILEILPLSLFTAEDDLARVVGPPPEAVAEDTLGNQQEAGMQGIQRARADIVQDTALDIPVRRQAGSQGLHKDYTPEA